jgi:thiosulfate dehydrogenase [quinone] large subunit
MFPERKKSSMFSQQNAPIRWGSLAIVVLAGAWTLVHLILGVGGVTASDLWEVALLILFVLALMVAFVQYAKERSALAASTSTDQFPEPAISKFFFSSLGSSTLWFVVRMYVGAEWLLAGWGKVTDPAWGTSGKAIAGFVAGALAKSTGAHPAVQGWYAWFLQNLVLPSSGVFSLLVTWGEVAVGVGLLLGVLTGIASGFGVLMNLNYLLAGTVSINPVLGMLGLFLCFSWRVCGWIGVDRWLLPALGLPWKPGVWFRPLETTRTASPKASSS